MWFEHLNAIGETLDSVTAGIAWLVLDAEATLANKVKIPSRQAAPSARPLTMGFGCLQAASTQSCPRSRLSALKSPVFGQLHLIWAHLVLTLGYAPSVTFVDNKDNVCIYLSLLRCFCSLSASGYNGGMLYIGPSQIPRLTSPHGWGNRGPGEHTEWPWLAGRV